MNVVVIRGTLSSEPIERTFAGGRNVMDWQVTTVLDGVKLSVPVQWHDPPKHALKYGEGDEVVVLGSVRRRFFQVGGATATRTEVVANQAARPTARVTVSRMLDQARTQLAA